nr:hypothetical protein [Tanacetum cinerariifolium]
IQIECLLAESVSKDICSVVLTPDNVVSISVEPCSNCDKEQTKNLKLIAEISKVKQLLVDKERRCSHIETEYLNLELIFQTYKECFENPQLKEELNAVRIKNDSLRDENVSIKARFQELYKSKAGSDTCLLTRITIPEVVSLENFGSVRTSEPTNNVTVTPKFSKKTLTNYKRKDINKVKDKQENDKIKTKSDKNGKRGEAGKSQKQLHSREQEKLKKIQKEGPKMQTPTKLLKK